MSAGAEAEHEQDLTWLRQAAEGDRRAFGALVRRHQGAVFRLASGLTRSQAAAEEVMQEAFIAAFRHAGSFRGESTVRTWLLTITRRSASRHRRHRAGEPGDYTPLHELGAEAGWGSEPDPEASAIDADRRAALTRALERLSDEDREVIVLRDLEELSGDEVASSLGLTLPAMKSRLHRARLRLMALLRDHDAGGEAGHGA